MIHSIRLGRPCLFVLILMATTSLISNAQATSNLITQPVNETQLVALTGQLHPAARPENDQGRVDDSLPLEHIIMMLKRTPEQQHNLTALIDQLHNPKSPAYHQWLTPEQFGAQFGPSESDLATLTTWMEAHGFTVEEIVPGRNLLVFSGDAGQVREAFHTELHHYMVNGEQHFANNSDPLVPAALAPVIAGFRSLNDFRLKPLHEDAGVAKRNAQTGEWEKVSGPLSVPDLTFFYNKQLFYLGPQDFYTIYNENPLFNATPPIDGHGVTIAVIEETNVSHTSDVTSFRQQFGLPTYPATPSSTQGGVNWMIGPGHGCTTVGVTSTGEETEALLDVEWAGATAPKAIVDFVACAGSNGIDLAAEYVTNYLPSTVVATSLSYGECELYGGSSGATFYRTEWEQEATEGITAVVSSGDSGSLVCDDPATSGTHNLSVNEISDTPYNISAGGTDFSDFYQAGDYNAYWNTTDSTVPNGSSALSYIPEVTWDSTCANTLLISWYQHAGSTSFGSTYTPEAFCNSMLASPSHNDLVRPLGGSGGVSTYNNLPTWQSVYGVGLTGNQTSTTLRNQPDLSLYASNGWWGHALLYCQSDTGYTCDYSDTSDDSNAAHLAAGGTSFVAPQINGVMALIVQKTGARQGVANYTLYNLGTLEYGSATTPNTSNLTSCSGSGQPGTSVGAGCIFHDIAGDTPNPWQGGTLTSDIIQPCNWSDVQTCYESSPSDTYGLTSLGNHPTTDSPAYPTSQGYDAATGLGSPNIANLVNNWNTATPEFASTTAISANPTTITGSASTTLTATVTATGRGETATAGPPAAGTVNFYIGSTGGTLLGTGALAQACTGTAPNNLVCPPSTATLSVQGTSLAAGANSIIAYFPGDGANDAPSTSSAATVTVSQGTQSPQTITFPTVPTQAYGVAPITLTATASSGLLVSYTVTSGPATASGSLLTITGAGSVTVQANQAGNGSYLPAPPVSQTFTVNPAVLTVAAQPAGKTYGQPNPAFTYTMTGFVGSDNQGNSTAGAPSLTTTATQNSPVGSYTITVALGTLGATNYTFTFVNSTLTITKANASVTPTAASKTYGAADPAFTGTLAGFLTADNVTATYTRTPGQTVLGSPYTISATLAPAGVLGNYNITYNTAPFNITPAVLTVTANNESGTHGQPLPGLAYGITGFVNGDTQSVVGGMPSLGTSATPTSAPGLYSITIAQGTLAAANYTFSFVNGVLTLQQGASSAALASVISNLYPGQSTLLTATVSITGSGAAPSGTVNFMLGAALLGTVTLTPSGSTAATAGLTLNASQLTLGANSISVVYSGNTDYTGSTSSTITVTLLSPQLSFGPVNVGTAAPVQSLSYSFSNAATLSAINILTLGAPGLNYTDGGSSTCKTGTAYTAGQSCTVTVGFTPSAPGLRVGAVVLFAAGNNLPLMTWYLSGVGQSGVAAVDPGTQSTLASVPAGAPYGLTIDGAGNIYLADNANGLVIKVAAGSRSQSTVVSGLNGPAGVAQDGAGNLYIADSQNNRVVMVPDENGTLNGGDLSVVNASGLAGPQGVALDGSGNIYIADTGNGRVVELAATGGGQATLASGLTNPHGVALDAAGNVYVASDSQVSEYPAGGGVGTLLGAGYSTPHGVAVDASGAVYVADTGNARIVKVAAGGGSQSILAVAGLTGPPGVAVDAAANAYVTNQTNLIEVNRTQPAALAFGNEFLGSTSAAQAVTLSDAGNEALSITNVAATGDFAQTDTCGSGLDAGLACAINVTFTPTATGSRSGSLIVTDNNNGVAGSTQTVSLTGTGINPAATVSPASLAFGQEALGTTSSTKTVTLTSSGTTNLNVSTITITGTNAGDFAETNNCPASLAPKAKCTISLAYAPTIVGAETATLAVTDSAANSPQTVALTGSGILPVTLSPTSLSFSNQAQGTTSAAKTVTLTNNLSTALAISSVTTSTDFGQTNTCGTSVPAKGKCTISVTFTPSIIGAETGTLTLTDGASNSPQTVSLAGTGIVQAAVSPTSETFSAQKAGTKSAAKSVMLTNNLSTPLTISSITFTGANPGDFAQTDTCGASLAANSHCTISITFTPAATGARTATMNVNDGANNSPQSVSLTGTGK